MTKRQPAEARVPDAQQIRKPCGRGESPRGLNTRVWVLMSCVDDVLRGRSRAGRLVVQLTDGEMGKLEGLASSAGGTLRADRERSSGANWRRSRQFRTRRSP